MKFIKSRKQFEASNVTFNVETENAYSYGWWLFVARINGKLVFNKYSYSPSTTKHQYKMRRLLEKQGLKIDLIIEAPRGLQSLDSAINHYESEIESLRKAMAKKGSKKVKNEERANKIVFFMAKIEQVKELQYTSPLEKALA